MWWTIGAWAAEPSLEKAEAHVARLDGLVARAESWWGEPASTAPPDAAAHRASGEALRAELVAAATEGRAVQRELTAARGRLAHPPEKPKTAREEYAAELARAEALDARITERSQARMGAVALVDAGIALHKVRAGEPDGLKQLGDQLYNAVTLRGTRADPVDAWLHPALVVALDAQDWRLVHGVGSYCEAFCADPAPAKEALGKLPEKFLPDARWVNLLPARP